MSAEAPLRRIALGELALPHVAGLRYVRLAISKAHVDDLASILDDARRAGSRWPFPAIDVTPLRDPDEIPERERGERTKEIRAWQQGYRWVVLDGVHRFSAATQIDWKEKIPSRPVAIATVADALVHQLQANLRHGLRLDPQAREQVIRDLIRDFKLSQKKVARIVGLSTASVSRILTGKQLKTGPRAKKRKAGGKTRVEWRPAVWAHDLAAFVQDSRQFSGKLLEYLSIPQNITVIRPVLHQLEQLLEAWRDLMEKEAPEKEAS
jgi:ParB-like chromosome segregation protein Spo0J